MSIMYSLHKISRRLKLPFLSIFVVGCLVVGWRTVTIYPPEKRAFNQAKVLQNRSILVGGYNGRLGNNIFQYASTYCIALHSGRSLVIKRRNSVSQMFQNIKAIHTSTAHWERLQLEGTEMGEKGYGLYDTSFRSKINKTSKTVFLSGFRQSYKYFNDCIDDLKYQFTLKDNLKRQIQQKMTSLLVEHFRQKMSEERRDENSLWKQDTVPHDITLIGVHVRALLLHEYNNNLVNYLSRGMDYFSQVYHNPVFLLCTDSVQWVRDNLEYLFLPHDVILVTSSFEIDFGILVSCNHSLITGGTFSWWSGFLAGGEVVYPEAFADWHNRHEKGHYRAEDYYPSHWKPL